MLKHLITKDILVVLLPEHCMLKSLVLFLLLHIILGIMNNGSFLVQLTGKLISAYVKSLVTVILLVPHCLYETYATPHISSYSVCIKSEISFIWSYCIKHISIN